MKLLSIILIVFFLGQSRIAIAIENDYKGYLPNECGDRCTCYRSKAIDKIVDRLQFADDCQIEVERLKLFIDENMSIEPAKLAFYQEPYFIMGGMVVSFSLGMLLLAMLK